jgi:hypothetical protein
MLGLRKFDCNQVGTKAEPAMRCKLELDANRLHGQYVLSADLDGNKTTLTELGTINLDQCNFKPKSRKIVKEKCGQTIEMSKADLIKKIEPDWSQTLIISNSEHEEVKRNQADMEQRLQAIHKLHQQGKNATGSGPMSHGRRHLVGKFF